MSMGCNTECGNDNHCGNNLHVYICGEGSCSYYTDTGSKYSDLR